mmetsp:Transcript_22717/g.58470  ORF Transcript_22717/g.58470 Transcript_22717/m.58470 type:complete len:240 (-) Transcript_22717:77-796(-)
MLSPRVEQLQHLRARAHLVRRVLDDAGGDVLEQRLEHLGSCVHHLFGVLAVLGRAPLDGVGCEGPRRAHKAEKRAFPLRLTAQAAQDLLDKRVRRLRVIERRAARADVLERADRVGDDRPLASHDVELDAEAGERRQDVREHDHAVHPESLPRLQRELHSKVGCLRALSERVLGRDGAERLHVTPGLTHEPHWCALRLLAARDAEQDVVVVRHAHARSARGCTRHRVRCHGRRPRNPRP